MRRIRGFHDDHPHFALWVFIMVLFALQGYAVSQARTDDKTALCHLSHQRWVVQHESIKANATPIEVVPGQEDDLAATARREKRNEQLAATKKYLDGLLGPEPICNG